MSIRIQELAVPKGNVCSFCELCGQKATTKCENCRVTHYCSETHKVLDSKSFHYAICKELAYLRSDHPLPFTEEDRIEANNALLQSKREILEMAEITTKTWLLKENAELAFPSAMIAYNTAIELEGPENLAVIYPICLVSEVFLRLGNLKAAQDYMLQASWISQKYDILPPTILSELYRIRGLVCLVAQNWKDAREAFAECVYSLAFEHGISDIRMAVGYGHLGLALLKFDNVDGAMASFHKMADNWLEYLLSQYEEKTIRIQNEDDLKSDKEKRELEFQYLETKIVIKWIYEAVRHLGMNEITDLINFKILCVQALYCIKDGEPDEATVFREEALATGTRTKQDKAVLKHRVQTLIEVLGDDYLMLWEKKHNRPRTVATKYLEMIKAINV